MDAGALLVFVLLLAFFFYRAKAFLRRVDRRTLEAADYTVCIRGLPADARAAEIGQYFSQFGEVRAAHGTARRGTCITPSMHSCTHAEACARSTRP